MEKECCTCKIKERSEDEAKRLINRLSRIEGQVRGVRRMVEESAYCVDILTQISAISSALLAFNKELLSNHIRTCVADGIRHGEDEKLEELIDTLGRMMR